jgi:acyl carrier protein
MSGEQINETVSSMLVEQFKVDPAKIQPDATFKKLGLDSLDLVSLAMALEDRMGIELPDRELVGIENYGQAVELIERKVKAGV